MKKWTTLSLTLVAVLAFAGRLAAQDEKPEPAKPEEKLSDEQQIKRAFYAIGFQQGQMMAQGIEQQLGDKGVKVDKEQLIKGLLAGLKGEKSDLSDEQMQAAFMALQAIVNESAAKASAGKLEANKKFLEEVSKQDGVKTTKSGLRYKVLKEGKKDGLKPNPEDTVKVHYTGTTKEGKVFDSSVQRGEPIEFPLNGVIRGWTEGVGLMTEGAKYRFWIPSDLAYGAQERGPLIGAHELLIFDVELLGVERARPVLPMPDGK